MMSIDADNSGRIAYRLDGPMPDPAAGVFDTMLVVGGRPVAYAAHLVRLKASLRKLYGGARLGDAGALVADAASDIDLGRLRLTVVPGDAGTAASVRAGAVNEALVFAGWGGAVEVDPVVVPGGIGPHKWADRRLLERAESDLAPALPLVVDSDGTVLEASRGNLFLVHDETVSTPPADGRVLPGITRAQAMDVARGLGIRVHAQDVRLERLIDADEIFLTSAVRGVEPVRRCANLAEWGPGEVTARIADQLQRMWLG